jgi:hypothetical protein
MANVLFPLGKEGILDGSIDFDTDDIRVMLVLSSYSYDAADNDLADLGAVDNGRSAALASKTVALGVADAADTTLTATAATASGRLVVFQHTGSDATARLIAFIDTATGLPFTPAAGGTVSITWAAGGIFAL